jgi:hypothetical protein
MTEYSADLLEFAKRHEHDAIHIWYHPERPDSHHLCWHPNQAEPDTTRNNFRAAFLRDYPHDANNPMSCPRTAPGYILATPAQILRTVPTTHSMWSEA